MTPVQVDALVAEQKRSAREMPAPGVAQCGDIHKGAVDRRLPHENSGNSVVALTSADQSLVCL